jgi:hypothetical protein
MVLARDREEVLSGFCLILFDEIILGKRDKNILILRVAFSLLGAKAQKQTKSLRTKLNYSF